MTHTTKKAESLIRQAGVLVKKNYSSFSTPRVRSKSRIEFVTSVDLQIHNMLSKKLPRVLGLPVLSEESTKKWKRADSYWVIDPIDGTTNYITRIPYFCIGIGLVLYNEIAMNLVYNPIANELFMAEKDGGAFLNGKRLHIDKKIPLSQSIVGVAYSHSQTSIQKAGRIGLRLRKTVHNTRHSGSTLLTFAYVAAGRLEASVIMGPITPWDSIPALLLIQEVDGIITDFSGAPYQIEKTKNVIASNGADHNRLVRIVSSVQ